MKINDFQKTHVYFLNRSFLTLNYLSVKRLLNLLWLKSLNSYNGFALSKLSEEIGFALIETPSFKLPNPT